MAVGKELSKLIAWIIKTFGKEIAIVIGRELQRIWARLFTNGNFAILGAKGTGKTALLWFLSTGKPFKVVKGRIILPEPTAGAVIVNKAFELQKGNWLSLKKEVGGEVIYRDLWRQIIADIDPRGIIYMLDGRLDGEALRAAATEAVTDALSHYTAQRRSLVAFHVFLSFSDDWATTSSVARRKLDLVSEPIVELIRRHASLDNLRFHVSLTELSPARDSWPEIRRALHHFGADLLQ